MAPTLVQAKHRKWWIAITAIIENLMFAAVLLGWSSLLLMLKKEGFYSSLCASDGNFTSENCEVANHTESNDEMFLMSNCSSSNDLLGSIEYKSCVEQDEILNRYFSIGSSLISGVPMILGIIMDKYGSRIIRMCGCWVFIASCMCFAVGSTDTKNLSFLIAPAIFMNGMGGVVYVFTSFPIPNLFQNIRSTMIAMMIGSYSASAVLYMLFKVAYDAGVSFQFLMMFHATVGFFTFVNAYMNIPSKPIPGPDDITYAIKFNFGDLKFDHKISGQEFLKHTSSVGRRMSNVDTAPTDSLIDMSHERKQRVQTFGKVLITPSVLWSFVMICVVQLRLIAYMGSLEMYFKASNQLLGLDSTNGSNTIEKYTLIFGILQVNCFIMAPIIGTILDWKLKFYSSNDGVYNGRPRKAQVIRNLMTAFGVTNILLLIFGIIVLFEKHPKLQVVAFVLHTVIRTFLHSSLGGLYACMYHFSHFGKLTGVSSFLSACFILLQDPLFVLSNTYLNGDPFWINVGLLLVALTGFGLPIYLWFYLKQYEEVFICEKTNKIACELSAIEEEGETDEKSIVQSRMKRDTEANGQTNHNSCEEDKHSQP